MWERDVSFHILIMKKTQNKNENVDQAENLQTLFEISREMFFDLYLESILQVAFKVSSEVEKTKGSSEKETSLTEISRVTARLIKNVEDTVISKVLESELVACEVIKEAQNILMKKEGISKEEATERIENHSKKLSKSAHEISKAIILVEKF